MRETFDQHDLGTKFFNKASSLELPLGFAKNTFMLALGHEIGRENDLAAYHNGLGKRGLAETLSDGAHAVSLDKVQLLPPRLYFQKPVAERLQIRG
jgi:hypothetical protein